MIKGETSTSFKMFRHLLLFVVATFASLISTPISTHVHPKYLRDSLVCTDTPMLSLYLHFGFVFIRGSLGPFSTLFLRESFLDGL